MDGDEGDVAPNPSGWPTERTRELISPGDGGSQTFANIAPDPAPQPTPTAPPAGSPAARAGSFLTGLALYGFPLSDTNAALRSALQSGFLNS
jgi:hypothetical protein